MPYKIDDFTGTQEQYIAHLEALVISYRQRHQVSSNALNSNASTSLPVKKRQYDQFVQWTPPEERLPTRGASCGTPKWKPVAEILVKETPKASEWAKELDILGIQSVTAVTFLVSGDSQTQMRTNVPLNRDLTPPSTTERLLPLQRLKEYALMMAQYNTRAIAAIRLTNLSQFIILSSCLVFRELEGPRQDIYEIVKVSVGRDISEKYIEELLRTVRFINLSIDTFNAEGWGDRASELLLIWNRPVTSYMPLYYGREDSLNFLKESLCTPDFVHEPSSEEGRTPLFIPSLVHMIIGKSVHVARIGHILGYKHADVLRNERVNPWIYFDKEIAS